MSKTALKNNQVFRSQQVLNALIAILRQYLPLICERHVLHLR
jgi:hypothetical protein